MKIRLVGAEFFHAGGRTGKNDETNSRYSQFAGRSKKLDLILANAIFYLHF